MVRSNVLMDISSVALPFFSQLPCAEGSLRLNGALAYVSQQAWIFSGTFKENVVFGEPFEQVGKEF